MSKLNVVGLQHFDGAKSIDFDFSVWKGTHKHCKKSTQIKT